MKIRSGFVSNSSSSSFVVVAPKADVEAVLSEMTKYDKAVAEFVMGETKSFMGQEIVIFQGSTGNCDSWEYGFEYEDEIPEDSSTWDSWESFISKLRTRCGENMIYSDSDY